MNLAAMQFKEPEKATEARLVKLREMESETVRIIECIEAVHATKDWSSLKDKLFDNLADSLRKELADEARKVTPDPNRLNRITGKLEWAEKYADLQKLADAYRVELMRIRHSLYGKES